MFGKQLFEEVQLQNQRNHRQQPCQRHGKNVKAMLGSAFNRMDLVTREEFDIQQQVFD